MAPQCPQMSGRWFPTFLPTWPRSGQSTYSVLPVCGHSDWLRAEHGIQIQDFCWNSRGDGGNKVFSLGLLVMMMTQDWSHQKWMAVSSHTQRCNLQMKPKERKTEIDKVYPWNFQYIYPKLLFSALGQLLVFGSKHAHKYSLVPLISSHAHLPPQDREPMKGRNYVLLPFSAHN